MEGSAVWSRFGSRFKPKTHQAPLADNPYLTLHIHVVLTWDTGDNMRHFNLRSLSIIGLAALLASCSDKKEDPVPSADADAGPGAIPDGGRVAVSQGKKIGPAGGQIKLEEVTVDIPEGALTSEQEIKISRIEGLTPEGYDLYSPVYLFEPEGLQFEKPINVTIGFNGNANLATLFWSRADTTGYERMNSLVMGNHVNGPVTHFSKGFIADGVNFNDPPDPSCGVVTEILAGTPSDEYPAVIPDSSAVAILVQVED